MGKLSKVIKKLSKKEAIKIAKTIELLLDNKVKSLDIKKLKGYKDVFRVRVGNQRIIFRREDKNIIILSISNRDENTYRNY